jgi:hypothetical protein
MSRQRRHDQQLPVVRAVGLTPEPFQIDPGIGVNDVFNRDAITAGDHLGMTKAGLSEPPCTMLEPVEHRGADTDDRCVANRIAREVQNR